MQKDIKNGFLFQLIELNANKSELIKLTPKNNNKINYSATLVVYF